MKKKLQQKQETAARRVEGGKLPSGPTLCALRYTLCSKQHLNNLKKQDKK
ncbi:MAG: hypothetical protein GTO45_21685 [Candidatus Aminicenantes bacterium]|nr:hypothetical protein [Candidatus Aminicenantes bacterium]NIM81368.1 hypothetical protein [Candidatus Aminicenantes bacterium]NIN20779.1 hypothetical protein [Candidatus Aminicenantes bacterium]NIN44557.1 hypothetical protein [Candidatus Aminicenantes bacterium]NIN87377.1 hypothetical protein [Candidatus Aminicenantes bacterium]